jgi:hypothetical protein
MGDEIWVHVGVACGESHKYGDAPRGACGDKSPHSGERGFRIFGVRGFITARAERHVPDPISMPPNAGSGKFDNALSQGRW